VNVKQEIEMKRYLVRAYRVQQIETYIIAKDEDDLEDQFDSVKDWDVTKTGEIYDVDYEPVQESYCGND
jgi:hypothetical protein